MTVQLPLLSNVRIASPCPARWEDMTGDDRSRLCAQCNKHVHNIASMTAEEAEALLRSHSGSRVCIQIYQRADGTILTQDCPVGISAARRRARRIAGRVSAAMGLFVAGSAAAVTSSVANDSRVSLRALRPFSTLIRAIFPAPPLPPPGPPPVTRVLRGEVCLPPPPPAPSPSQGSNP